MRHTRIHCIRVFAYMHTHIRVYAYAYTRIGLTRITRIFWFGYIWAALYSSILAAQNLRHEQKTGGRRRRSSVKKDHQFFTIDFTCRSRVVRVTVCQCITGCWNHNNFVPYKKAPNVWESALCLSSWFTCNTFSHLTICFHYTQIVYYEHNYHWH